MRCLICDSTDKWKNVDEFRLKPMGMEMCQGCGFISYPSRWKSKEEIKAYYRKEYRNPPTSANFFACQRKVHFHSHFLESLFKEWKASDKKSPKIFEVGAAHGVALNWLKEVYKGAEVGGTELTLSMRRVAFQDFGIELAEDFDTSKKHDLIMSYKVAEHQLDADKELQMYHDHLTDDGHLYIGVPTWFGSLNNFGASGFDLEYYYDPNHINVWTRNNFENLLKKTGFEIVKQDHVMYDSVYLCKKSVVQPMELENPADILEKLAKVKEAYLAFMANDNDTAIQIWPSFPIAHVSRAESKRKECSEQGWEWTKENIIDRAIKDCPEATESVLVGADFALRFQRFEESIEYSKKALLMKPNNPQAITLIINAIREMAIRSKDAEEQTSLFQEARRLAGGLGQVSAQHMREAIDYNYLFSAQIPMPNEN